MKILAHYKKQQLDNFFNQIVQLHHLYGLRSYDLDTKLLQFLDQLQTYYKQIGVSNDELVICELISYYKTAQFGIDPKTSEKLKTGKRDNLLNAAFYCLNQVGSVLKSNLEEIITLLEDARQTINNILLSMIQTGHINSNDLIKIKTIDDVEIFWLQIIQDSQIGLIDKKLKQNLLQKDITIILDEQITLLI